MLGRGTSFVGKLTFDSRTRIDGKFQGEIVSDGVLILGDTAEIDATVVVGALIVRGATVRGNLRAKHSIEVYAPAKVYGALSAPEVVIEKGVTMEGSVKMGPIDVDAPESPVAAKEPSREPSRDVGSNDHSSEQLLDKSTDES